MHSNAPFLATSIRVSNWRAGGSSNGDCNEAFVWRELGFACQRACQVSVLLAGPDAVMTILIKLAFQPFACGVM
jgi:hypothetical protein